MPAAPQPPGAHHPLASFDCGKPGLNEWLICHAMPSQTSGSAKAYVAVQGDGIAGYFSLTVGQADASAVSERIRKGLGGYPVLVVILARLAVSYQRFGFEPSPLREQQLLLLLQDARRLV